MLPEPYEFLELAPGSSAVINVTGYQDGSAEINPSEVSNRHLRIYMSQKSLSEPPPSGTPISIEVPVLRLFGQREDKPSPTNYWDVSSKTLRADLLARFSTGLSLPAVIKLTANGAKPFKRYSVEVLPNGAAAS